jgi:hypothetical protein
LRWLSVIVLVLVALVLYAMGQGLSEVVRGLEPELTWGIMGVALAVGAGLVKFAHKAWSTILFSILSGVLFSAMMVGRLWDDLWLLLQNIWFWVVITAQAVVASLQGELTEPSGVIFLYLLEFSESVFVMLERLVLWIWYFPRLSSDVVATLMVWGVLLWLSVLWAAWFLWRKQRPFEAVIPAFLLVALARTAADASSSVVLVMLGMTIGLMVLSAQADREADWDRRGVGYSELIRKNTTQAALLLSAVLVVSSAWLTSIDVNELRERWEEFTTRQDRGAESDNDVSSSLGIERTAEQVTLAEQFGTLSRGGLPTDHLIGSGPELSDQVVMVVRVEELDQETGEPLEVDPAAQNYYFRSLTYDRYTSQGWFSNGGRIYVYQGGQEAVETYTSRQRLVRQEVRYEMAVRGAHVVHAIGELAVVDRQYNVSWREGRGLSVFQDLFGATLDSQSYEAYSVIPAFSEEGLRQTFPDYPDWMQTRYLELPPTVPERVVDLAYEVTAQEISAYDKAVAIEQYLRTFPYTLDLPIKPANLDIADYFLFDVQRGYCDYYASTMVVMARAVGIPARLAVGYVGGTYDPENAYYVVTADQAHAWVEIYFPEYGWVTFEPTAGRPAAERENQALPAGEFEERQIVFEEDRSGLSGLQITLRWLAGLFVLGVVAFFVWLRLDIIILRYRPIEKSIALIYQRVLVLGRMLGVERGTAQTPLEFADRLRERIEELREAHPRLEFLEKTPRRVEALVVLANKAAYHAKPPDAFDRAQAVDHWVTVRRHLGIAWAWHRLAALRPKIKIRPSESEFAAKSGLPGGEI